MTFFSSFGSLGTSRTFSSADERFAPRDQRLELFLRQLAHVGVASRGQLFGLRHVARDALVLAELLDCRLDLGQRLGVLPILGRIALDLG